MANPWTTLSSAVRFSPTSTTWQTNKTLHRPAPLIAQPVICHPIHRLCTNQQSNPPRLATSLAFHCDCLLASSRQLTSSLLSRPPQCTSTTLWSLPQPLPAAAAIHWTPAFNNEPSALRLHCRTTNPDSFKCARLHHQRNGKSLLNLTAGLGQPAVLQPSGPGADINASNAPFGWRSMHWWWGSMATRGMMTNHQ